MNTLLNHSCNGEYIGETKVMTRTIKHHQDSISEKFKSLGVTKCCLKCHCQFNWLHPKTLSRESRYKSRKIRESLEIKRSKCNSTSKSNINRNDGNLVKNNSDLESVLQSQRNHCIADLTLNWLLQKRFLYLIYIFKRDTD